MLRVTRRQAMSGVLASLALPVPRSASRAAPLPLLKELAAAKGFLYGTCVQVSEIEAKDDFTALVAAQCNCLVPETALSWNTGLESFYEGKLDFSDADIIIDFAKKHRLPLRGHYLLWYQGVPDWFKALPDAASAEAAVVRFITTMCTRFKDAVFCWEVVNEPINLKDERPDNLRRAGLLDKLGPGFIDLAHHVARATDPNARLVVNDYGFEYDLPEQNKKRDALLRLLERMKKAGTPVDTFGVQAHLRTGGYPMSQAKLQKFFAEIAGMGLDIHITELDCTDERTPPLIVARDQLVADEYARFLDVALDEQAVNVVVTWGLSDRHSWINGEDGKPKFRQADGQPYRPLPYDVSLRKKPARDALARAFENARPRKPALASPQVPRSGP
jgi:endo-1,4-beta-xylanase